MSGYQHLDRRRFLGHAAAVTAPLLLGGRAVAANDRITLGFIGVGTMGRGHVSRFLGHKEVQIVAICDVVAERRDHCQKMVEDRYAKDKESGSFKGCKTYKDFRDVLARDDINAVVIATPDHWHTLICLAAAKAKKDIYCEKPLTHCISEGRKIVETVDKNKVIFQVGSQQRSEFGGHFRRAVEIVRNGLIGKVKTIRIGVGGPPRACDLPEQQAPEGTDWDLWLGPSPQRAYNEKLCPKGVHSHFPEWRAYKEYAGGGLADMGAHHFDIAQWALDMDNSGPVKIEPPEKGDKGLRFVYANGIEMFHGDSPADCYFEGSDGKVFVSRGGIKTDPVGILDMKVADGFKCYPSTNHAQNWIDCMLSRKPTICPAEVGHRSATICHLAAIGYDLRRALKWDPAKEVFVGDDEANKRLDLERRGAWKL